MKSKNAEWPRNTLKSSDSQGLTNKKAKYAKRGKGQLQTIGPKKGKTPGVEVWGTKSGNERTGEWRGG